MNQPRHRTRALPPPSRLGLFDPPAESAAGVRWLINGYPAIVIIWTQEQWADLKDRPIDAQFHPNGVWCALRFE